jgi:hypothetical protein
LQSCKTYERGAGDHYARAIAHVRACARARSDLIRAAVLQPSGRIVRAMRITVTRRYRFVGVHHLPGYGPPYDTPHEHVYTVDVEALSSAPPTLRTDELDAAWGQIAPDSTDADAVDLNDTYDDTTVEGLAATWLAALSGLAVVAVEVWEDASRMGRASV